MRSSETYSEHCPLLAGQAVIDSVEGDEEPCWASPSPGFKEKLVAVVPYIETDVLRFDVIAGITAQGFHRLCGLSDPVAVAWRSDKVASRNGWAARLAKVAKVSEATVYNRRDLWRDKFRIDIAFPLQLYSDILASGP
jgi:hypothetical protein